MLICVQMTRVTMMSGTERSAGIRIDWNKYAQLPVYTTLTHAYKSWTPRRQAVEYLYFLHCYIFGVTSHPRGVPVSMALSDVSVPGSSNCVRESEYWTCW